MSLMPSARSLSPFDIPELLDQIFSLIDHDTIARTVVLVCRQWFLLNQHHLYRTVVWDGDWKPAKPRKALIRLSGAERLVIRVLTFDKKRHSPDVQGALRALRIPPPHLRPPSFLQSILNPLLGHRPKQSTRIIEVLHRPLQEIDIVVTRAINEPWANNLCFPSTLRSLTIQTYAMEYLDISRILATCPLLESIRLLVNADYYPSGPWKIGGQTSLPDHLVLRSLVLERPCMTQAWMEDLLRKTPDLEVLKLIMITHVVSDTWDWLRFSRYLQALALPLKQFHYSRPWTVSTNDDQEEAIFAICPRAQNRTILAKNLTPRIAECLMNQPVVLTTLDILLPKPLYCSHNRWFGEEDNPTSYTAQLCHQLLCECPNLRNLKSLRIPYMVEYMDLHHRNHMTRPYENLHQQPRVQPVPGIWICRGLETLHLNLHIHDRTCKSIAYGYIARVCPRLHDLRISFPDFCEFSLWHAFGWQHPFVLEEGLCLLSRLKWLERLRVEYRRVECQYADLSWLCQSGRTAEHREWRREVAEKWTSRLEEEAVMETARVADGAHKDILGIGASDSELMASLSNLGMIQDVKDMVTEMDSDDFVCLPELRWLACGTHLDQRPEKELRSLFYSASLKP